MSQLRSLWLLKEMSRTFSRVNLIQQIQEKMACVLAKLPYVHHFLATLYNKTDQSGLAPDAWVSRIVILAYKAGSTSDPPTFRPMALISCLGKPYHQIKAERLTELMTANGYIDTSTQKAFLKCVNGCVEHIQVLQEVIQDVKAKKKLSFLVWSYRCLWAH